MLKIAICDDEKIFCDLLQEKVINALDDINETFTLHTYTNTDDLRRSENPFDVIFLDIKMPTQDGLEFAEELRLQGNDSSIIFISSFPEYVFDVFRLEAEDFLCKPIDEIKLHSVLLRIIQKKRADDKNCLFIQTNHWSKSIKLQSIFYCEVINRIIYIHTAHEVINYYGKIEDLGNQLDSRFYRCHRSYFVNLDFVMSYSNGEIVLENSEHIPVSRLRQKEFMGYMLQYMKRGNRK